MSDRATRGYAYSRAARTGQPLARVVLLEHSGRADSTPGHAHGYVVFEEIYDARLRDRLTKLAASTRANALLAGVPDDHSRPLGMDLTLDDGRHLESCRVWSPASRADKLEDARFVATLDKPRPPASSIATLERMSAAAAGIEIDLWRTAAIAVVVEKQTWETVTKAINKGRVATQLLAPLSTHEVRRHSASAVDELVTTLTRATE